MNAFWASHVRLPRTPKSCGAAVLYSGSRLVCCQDVCQHHSIEGGKRALWTGAKSLAKVELQRKEGQAVLN